MFKSRVLCHVFCVTCFSHVFYVTCFMSRVKCHVLNITRVVSDHVLCNFILMSSLHRIDIAADKNKLSMIYLDRNIAFFSF